MRGPIAPALLLALPLLPALPGAALAQHHQSARLHTRVLNQPFAYANSVAISGDWAVVGSTKHIPADGSVFFYHRESTGWVFRQEVQNPIQDSGKLPTDIFGTDVALEGKLALVGARLAGDNDEGMVVVYELQGSKWVEVDRLGPEVQQFKEGFGFDLAFSGERIAVTAPFEEHPAQERGVVYVFDRKPGGWVQTARLHAPPQTIPFQFDAATLFGWSVDVAGKWLVVGAPGGPNNGLGGAAFVYHETPDGWKLDDVLVDTVSPIDDDWTGGAVAISEDGRTILVGEPQLSGSFQARTGSVLVFERGLASPGEWDLAAVLKASDGSLYNGSGDQFGFSVAIQGDLAVIGAPFANGNGPHAGTAYVFERTGGTWLERERLVRSGVPADGASLGQSVSISHPFVVAGSPFDKVDGVAIGAAFVFELGFGTPFCPAAPNSSGEPAQLAAVGSNVVADENLMLSVHDAPPKSFGFFFFGPTQTQMPLGDGTLCVGGQITRLAPLALTGDTGAAMHAVDFTDSSVAGNILAGSTWSFQFWFRDTGWGLFGSNLSEALEISFE